MNIIRTIAKMATQLIPLQEVERLSPSVIRILGGNPGKVNPENSQKIQLIAFSLHCKVRGAVYSRQPSLTAFQGQIHILLEQDRDGFSLIPEKASQHGYPQFRKS
jgi:hypothetical protein